MDAYYLLDIDEAAEYKKKFLGFLSNRA